MAVVAGDNQTFYAASEFGGIFEIHGWRAGVGTPRRSPADGYVGCRGRCEQHGPGVRDELFDGRVNPISGIQVSNDGGLSWTHPVTAYPDPSIEGTPLDNTPQVGYSATAARRTQPSAFGIGIPSDNTNIVFIGTNAGVARTTNGGLSWQILDPTPATPSDSSVWDVVVQAGGPNGLGIVDIVGDDGHLRSVDGGNTWTNANSLPAAGRGRGSISVSPDESYVLFVAGANGTLYESDDAGATWTSLGRTDPIRGGNQIPSSSPTRSRT